MRGIVDIWIEAEEWPAGQWQYDNANTDVIVTLTGGDRYAGTFFTYSNIAEISARNSHTGECMGGR